MKNKYNVLLLSMGLTLLQMTNVQASSASFAEDEGPSDVTPPTLSAGAAVTSTSTIPNDFTSDNKHTVAAGSTPGAAATDPTDIKAVKQIDHQVVAQAIKTIRDVYLAEGSWYT